MDKQITEQKSTSHQALNPWLEINQTLGLALIDHLYRRLDGLYAGKWRNIFAAPDAIENWRQAWAEALHARHVTPAQIKRGLSNCIDMYDWPPSLPEFIKACQTPARDETLHKVEQSLVGLPPPKREMPDDVKAAFAAIKNRSVLKDLNA